MFLFGIGRYRGRRDTSTWTRGQSDFEWIRQQVRWRLFLLLALRELLYLRSLLGVLWLLLAGLWRLRESLMLMSTIMRIRLRLLCYYRCSIRMSVALHVRSVRRRYRRDRAAVVAGAVLLILDVLW